MSSSSYNIRLPRDAAARLGRLLPMEYAPKEIAAELQIGVRRIWNHMVPAGCPHRRDSSGHIWIVGTAFAAWFAEVDEARRHPMADDEGWCMGCQEPVRMAEPLTVTARVFTENVQWRCPVCGAKVNRMRRRERNR